MREIKPREYARIFPTEEDFINRFYEYIDDCEVKEKMPNVAGFCFFGKFGRKTFYDQKNLYPHTYDIIHSALEDLALNNKTVAPTVLSLYLKNKCGYTDKQEVESKNENINTNKNIDLSHLTVEELKKLIDDED